VVGAQRVLQHSDDAHLVAAQVAVLGAIVGRRGAERLHRSSLAAASPARYAASSAAFTDQTATSWKSSESLLRVSSVSMWSVAFAMAASSSSTVGSFLPGRFLFVVCIVVLRVDRPRHTGLRSRPQQGHSVKNRPRWEPRSRSTRGHAPRRLRAVAELFALDEEDVVLGGAALEPGLLVVVAIFAIGAEHLFARRHAREAHLEGPVRLRHHEDLGVRVLLLQQLDQLAHLHVVVSVGVVRLVRPVRDDIQASFWRPSKAKKREIVLARGSARYLARTPRVGLTPPCRACPRWRPSTRRARPRPWSRPPSARGPSRPPCRTAPGAGRPSSRSPSRMPTPRRRRARR